MTQPTSKPWRSFSIATRDLDAADATLDLGDFYRCRVYLYPHKDDVPNLTSVVALESIAPLVRALKGCEDIFGGDCYCENETCGACIIHEGLKTIPPEIMKELERIE